MSGNSALLVIDVQVGMLEDENYPIYNGDTLLTTIRHLIDKARQAGVPVVFVRHQESNGPLEYGTPAWQVHPALGALPGDVFIDKRTPDSFHETSLQHELDARGITKPVLTGLQTEMCVDATFRRAVSLGYDVTLVTDAHSTSNSPTLSAQQIIEHHNATLKGLAGHLQPASDLSF